MITIDEVRTIPLFSKQPDRVLEYVVNNCADIGAAPGEYVVTEGEQPALLIPVSGKLDMTKLIDGVESVVDVRRPGDLFGEVPLILNTPFLTSLRAVEASRVIRIEPREYHSIATMAPDLAAVVSASALTRIHALQDIFAHVSSPEVVVVGSRWDAACHCLRSFLQNNQVTYEWFGPHDPYVGTTTIDPIAAEKCPYVRLKNGTVLCNPTVRDLATALGLSVTPKQTSYDVVIVGGGPAGLASAVYGASEGLSTILVERDSPGGQAGSSSRIENYLGFPVGIPGDELAHRAFSQSKRFGAEILVTRTVVAVRPEPKTVQLDGGDTLSARVIMLALGVTWRRLAVESIERLVGRGVYYGASRSETRLAQGHDVYLVGAGNSAGQAAVYFSGHARSVTLLVRGDSLARSMSYYLIEQLKTRPNVRWELRSEVVAAYGDGHLEEIDVINRESGAVTRRKTSALFIMIGADADTDWLPSEIARDAGGYVLTGQDVMKSGRWPLERDPYLVETSVPGIFAAGDVRAGSVKRVAAGVGEGSMAIAFVHQFLQPSG
jgi:thioredoxin reductase (NADPH)